MVTIFEGIIREGVEAAEFDVENAAEAARALPFSFTLTARAENYLLGRPDLDDTIQRLQDYEAAGAQICDERGDRRARQSGEPDEIAGALPLS